MKGSHANIQPNNGFTLLEVMIVLAIITGVLIMVIPRIGNKNNEMKAAVRKMIVLPKELRTRARLEGASYRVVFDLKEREDDQQEYWVERSNSSVLLPKDKNILIEAEEKLREEREQREESKSPSTEGFTPADGHLAGKKQLPGGMRFESIEVAGLDRPIESGLAYIHFHPQGLVEEAAIHIKYGSRNEDGLQWTIAIHPLTGHADIITENVSLREIKQQ